MRSNKSSRGLISFMVLAMLTILPIMSFAVIPQTVSYQGYLTDENGLPVDTTISGPIQMIFAIYDTADPLVTTPLWTETHSTVEVTQGVYSVLLGSVNPLNSRDFNNQLYLGVTVGTDLEMTPRQPMASVGTALNADLLEGQHASEFSPVVHEHHGTDITSGVVPAPRISGTIARDSEILPTVLANDGTGSTLDADLLDGQEAVDFAASAHNHYSLDAADGSPVNVLSIDDFGNVVIQGAGGGNKLHVTGSNNTDIVFFQNDIISGSYAGGLRAHGNASQVISGQGIGGIFVGSGGSTSGNAYGSQSYAEASGSSTAYGVYSDATGGSTTGREWAFYGLGDGYFSGNVGIGTSTPNEQLEITGNLRLPNTTATTGIIFSGSDTFIHEYGVLNFFAGRNAGNTTTTGYRNTATGAYAFSSNTEGTRNTAAGAYALFSNTTGNYNTAIGSDALFSNTGSYNTAIGSDALPFNTTGQYNIATGALALQNNTTASKNTALGFGALQVQSYDNGGTSWDSHNTAVGYNALLSNEPTGTLNGIRNTAVGSQALTSNTTGDNNTATGSQALYSNTTGINNTATGVYALRSNTTGYWNTAIGDDALRSNTTGGLNTATGSQALYSNTTASKNTALGHGALYTQSYDNGGTKWDSHNTAVGHNALLLMESEIQLLALRPSLPTQQVASTQQPDLRPSLPTEQVSTTQLLESMRF
jgi:hypothetical protein